ncbi:MAG: FecR domain-containing protein [Telmatospirillum sp.]|nr:FecR domain-containing protein [Telmatospirillum sp.]
MDALKGKSLVAMAVGSWLAAMGPLLSTAAAQPAGDAVGVTSAVNPDARGVRPDGAQTTLLIGTNVIFKERIETGPSGQVQLLFNDQSAISIGPNARVVIDQFVYNPATGSGQMAVSLARGTMRFVGGKISKQNEVAITTPSATIGIRGGVTMPTVGDDGSTRVVHVFGATTVRTPDGQSATLTRPGFVAEVAAPAPPPASGSTQAAAPAPGAAQSGAAPTSTATAPAPASAASGGGISVRRASDAEISATKSQLESGPAQQQARAAQAPSAPGGGQQQVAGAPAPGGAPGAGALQGGNQQGGSPASGGPTQSAGAQSGGGQTSGPPGGTGGGAIEGALGGSGMTAQNSAQAPAQIATVSVGPPPPPPAQQAAQSVQTGGQLANTANAAQASSTSALSQGYTSNLSFTGRARFGTWRVGPDTFGNLASTPVFDATDKSRSFNGQFVNGRLRGTLNNGEIFSIGFPVDAAGRFFSTSSSGATSPGGALSGNSFLSSDGRFFFGDYSTPNGERVAVFGGTAVSGSALSNSTTRYVREYTLRADPALGAQFPFLAPVETGGSFTNPSIGKFTMVTPAAAGQSGRGLQVNFALDGSGSSQRSVFSVMTANVFNDSNGNLTISGAGRAFFDYSGNQRPGRGSFAATTETDGSGNSFFGSLGADGAPSNFVFGQNSTNNSNQRVTDGGYLNLALNGTQTEQYYRSSTVATYSQTVGSSTAPTTSFFNGYAAGLTERNGGTNVVRQISNDPTQTVIRLNAANNSATALLAIERVGAAESFQLGFGARPDSFTGAATSLASSTTLADIRNSSYTTFANDGARSSLVDAKTWVAREMINPGAGFASDGSPNSFSALVTSNLTNTPASVTDQTLSARQVLVPSTTIASNVLSAAFPNSSIGNFESMQWGFWASQVQFPDPLVTGGRTDRYQLATWIAGVLPALGDIPTTGTATYNGHVIGTVNNNGARYTTGGSYSQTWNFASDSGTATISNFDGLGNITATLSSANKREFTGSLAGTGITGNLAGSFFRGSTDPVKNVGGNFNISGTNYQAGGIVAGQR